MNLSLKVLLNNVKTVLSAPPPPVLGVLYTSGRAEFIDDLCSFSFDFVVLTSILFLCREIYWFLTVVEFGT